MFDVLDKYRKQDHFFLTPQAEMQAVCNAPKEEGGVFVVYALRGGSIDMICIGASVEGESLYQALVEGLHKGKEPRGEAWKALMDKNGIEGLDVYWYVTQYGTKTDDPAVIEKKILKLHKEIYGGLPKWNKGK